mmetsp:Transcript_91595/g.144787  ORF Transcript_91595/g.144787 Transcript_91595/m.144787 type:complete len:196 (+) Transcript_91595:42-629(+)|eukprot:CAMPEP_0169120752 /NCGR_PEP_ID=MMETSP1015-20121227/32280_1 /TAXON_ID=342587 /ORGANISM="Karlodinium micrum, Strain CCMP2283" /LENGTH=195 /DNA_ID=CAMNT_0009183765 /DNA_START=42 /DNA_END=629 /DNA_ORIENTATION=-
MVDPTAEAASKKGVTQRIWGKLQEPEKSRLVSAEKRFGMTWKELHSYKDKMVYPILPTMMAVEELPDTISLCETPYRGLDRCLEQGMAHENPGQPYARMQICKPHWIQFVKCTKRRDELIMRSVKKWERTYFDALDAQSKTEYLEDLDTKTRYFLYASSHTADTEKKRRLDLNAHQCAVRQAALINPPSSADDAV